MEACTIRDWEELHGTSWPSLMLCTHVLHDEITYVCWSFFSSSTESNKALEKQSSQPQDDPLVKEKSPEVEVRAFEFQLPNSFSWWERDYSEWLLSVHFWPWSWLSCWDMTWNAHSIHGIAFQVNTVIDIAVYYPCYVFHLEYLNTYTR